MPLRHHVCNHQGGTNGILWARGPPGIACACGHKGVRWRLLGGCSRGHHHLLCTAFRCWPLGASCLTSRPHGKLCFCAGPKTGGAAQHHACTLPLRMTFCCAQQPACWCRYLFKTVAPHGVLGHLVFPLTAQHVAAGTLGCGKAACTGQPMPVHQLPKLPGEQGPSLRVDKFGVTHEPGCKGVHKGLTCKQHQQKRRDATKRQMAELRARQRGKKAKQFETTAHPNVPG